MKKLWISIAVVVVVLLAILTGGSFYMIDYSLRPHQCTLEESLVAMKKNYPQITPWIDSLQAHQALKDTFIVAPDGTKMHAIYAYASQPTKRTAVIVHGYTDNSYEMLHLGYMYNHSLDYNILLPDLRNAGLSGGDAIQMGWLDRKDVMQWIGELPKLFGDTIDVAVHGISMGAATTMMLSGEKLPDYVKCFVEDCGYTSVWDQFEKELDEQFGLPAFPLMYTASWACDWQCGWNFQEASAEEQVKKCDKPMLFIHGDKDDYVPTWMVYEVYKAKPGIKEMWITKGVDHARSYKIYPAEYTGKVKSFMDKYLK